MMRIASLTLLLAAFAGGACYKPDLSGDPGAFTCSNEDKTCPPNYSCDVAKRVCVKKSTGQDAAPGDPKVADLSPHETAPDASPKDLSKADASAPAALTCALGKANTLGNTAGGSSVGLAYDNKEKALYASYVTSIPRSTRHQLLVRQAILGTQRVKMLVKQEGTLGLDTAVAAQNGQWVVVYQEQTSTTSQRFMALRSDDQSHPIRLASGYMAGQQPDVILLPADGNFAAAHALARTNNDLATPKGQAIRVKLQQAQTPPKIDFYTSSKASTGFDNKLAINPSTRTIYYAMLAKNATSTTAWIAKSPFATATSTPQDIRLGKLPTFLSGNAPGLDIAFPRLVAAAKPQGNADSEIQYRPDLNQNANAPVPFKDEKGTPLINLGRPRIAARDGMVAVSAVDARKNLWITVQDEKAATKLWSPALEVSTPVAIDRIVATPGSSADEVIFQILYRAATFKKTLYLRSLTCKRKK